jgi:hypothetical protein
MPESDLFRCVVRFALCDRAARGRGTARGGSLLQNVRHFVGQQFSSGGGVHCGSAVGPGDVVAHGERLRSHDKTGSAGFSSAVDPYAA